MRLDKVDADASLEVSGLSAGYGQGRQRRVIVSDISLKLRAGSSLVLLGQNGAGKSTLLRALFGLNHIMAGSVNVDGHEMGTGSPLRSINERIAFVPQGRGVFQDLTVAENLHVAAVSVKKWRKEAIDGVLDRLPELKDLLQSKAGVLSGGQARSLAIAMGLVRQPKWLLLDEPTIGLSPQRIDRIFGFLKTLQTTDHIGVIIAEQNVLAAVSSFDEAIVLRSGRVSWRGSCSTLRELASVDLAKLL